MKSPFPLLTRKATFQAVALLVLANVFGALCDAVLKSVGGHYPTFELLAFRQFWAIVLLTPLLLWRLPRGQRRTRFWWHHWARALLWLAGGWCMIEALVGLPLATAISLFYAMPLVFLPIGAVMGERLDRRRIGAAVVGFAGVLIVMRPTSAGLAAFAAMGVAVTSALSVAVIKHMGRAEHPSRLIYWTNVCALPLSLAAAALTEWQRPDVELVLGSLAATAFLLMYQYLVIRVYQLVEASAVMPAEYTGLVSAGIIGWVWFGEVPDWPTVLGAVVTFVPVLLLASGKEPPPRTGTEDDGAAKSAPAAAA